MQYVYKIQAGNFIKIGIATDVRSRISQLQTGNPYRLELLSCYGFDDACAVERALHQAYAKSRAVGEWFELTAKQSDDFEIICQMLGGERSYFDDNVSNDEIEEADAMAQPSSDGKWDYAAMFADGWNIGTQGRDGKYWNWRRGKNNSETIYGGMISKLPCAVSEMRRKFETMADEKVA